jgi:hypothetical protein
MATKKLAPSITVTGCSVTNTPATTNEHTRAAVEALALSAKANADAIAEIAKALRGADAKMGAGFRFGSFDE